MTAYRNAPVSGVTNYTNSAPSDPQKYIDVTFHNGAVYRYGIDGVGRPVSRMQLIDMKELATRGQGLCRYITRNRL